MDPEKKDAGGFASVAARIHFPDISTAIASRKAVDVQSALDRAASRLPLDFADYCALISPAADAFLERMAQQAREVTRQRFGNVIQIFAPLYLSNECNSHCTYCGFSVGNSIRRKTLTMEELDQEANELHSQGIRHVLLLTGEDYRATPVEYLEQSALEIRDRFPSISIEVYPLKQGDYERLRLAGVDGLAVYQETYDPVRYREVHLQGMKKRMEFRLNCPDRGGKAGLRKIAIGALLGLSDPASEVYMLGLHGRYLMHQFWQTQLSVSLPRLREATGVSEIPEVKDREFVRYLLALRLFLPDAVITLSTRESPAFRDRMANLCVTQMSAGSKTDPGGYRVSDEQNRAAEQFSIDDERSIADIRKRLQELGKDPIFLDWASVLK
ncbi:MAG: 2-iminoacetate synthase ThiH [Spirochaetaceae bacterium]|nr:2-iminoacetate synthase ThiH [Spirochaetaceae bacterium]